MSIISDVLALSRRMRQDPEVRKTVLGILVSEDCATLAELAEKNPLALTMLLEMFEEMDADDAAIDAWTRSWRPANHGHLGPPL